MPEPPDFEQIARRVADETGVGRLEEWDSGDPDRVVSAIVEQLRLLWNARGAADGAALKAELQRALDLGPQPEASRPAINLEQMIKRLDR